MAVSKVFDSSVASYVISRMLGIKKDASFSINDIMNDLGDEKMIIPTQVAKETDLYINDHCPEKKEEYESLWDSKLDEIDIERRDCKVHDEWLHEKQKEIIENPTGSVATNWINLKRSYLAEKKINVNNDMSNDDRRKALRILRTGLGNDNEILSQVMKYSEDHKTVLFTNDGDMVMMNDYLKSNEKLHLSIWRPPLSESP